MGITILVEINGDFLNDAVENFDDFGKAIWNLSSSSFSGETYTRCLKGKISFHRHDTAAHKDWLKFKKKHGGQNVGS